MDPKKLQERLRRVFQDELQDSLDEMSACLAASSRIPEAAGRKASVQELFRIVHNIKGSARSVALGAIEAACRPAEAMLGEIRVGKRLLAERELGLLVELVDRLGEARTRLAEGGDPEPGPLEGLGRSIAGHLAVPPPGTPTANAPPAPGPATPAVPPPGAHGAAAALSIRVSDERLDSLLLHASELATRMGRVEEWAKTLDGILGQVAALEGGWRREARQARRRPGSLLEPRVRGERELEWIRTQAAELGGLRRSLAILRTGMGEEGRAMQRETTSVDDSVRSARLVPFGDACRGLDGMVRDLARDSGKQVELEITGRDLELDHGILRGLREVLLHLVRNAVDHGLEPAEARRAAGKPEAGRVAVAARLAGARVLVSVSDDGRGIPEVDAAGAPVLARIFEPGFSTAARVTDVSGCGVGLDIVRVAAEKLRGLVRVETRPRAGTRFEVDLPLTLVTRRVVLAEAGGTLLAVVSDRLQAVRSTKDLEPAGPGGRAAGGPELVDLAEVLTGRSPAPGNRFLLDLVGGQRSLVVDRVLGEEEVTIHQLPAPLRGLPGVVGGTLRPGERVAPVLDPERLAPARAAEPRPPPVRTGPPGARRRVLVVDDTRTTLALVSAILEGAGYLVSATSDGSEAWQALLRQPFDLVVSDVEMPRLDGLELTRRMRSQKGLRDLPVVLLTGLESSEDRSRGLQAGADAYFVKRELDQAEFLSTLGRLLASPRAAAVID